MPETLRISLTKGVSGVSSISDGGFRIADPGREANPPSAAARPQTDAAAERQKKELAQLCQTIGDLAGKLDRLYEQTLVHSRGDIARLAVEIARKIVMCEIPKGGYDIHGIIEEALKGVPTHHDLVIRVNPQDLRMCQQFQEEHPDSDFAKLQFVADRSIGRANCMIETPRGVVRSFVDEGLERIREALEKSQ
jgi:flagellar biosynthesis/type III secretory pathway protein FliH